MLLIKLLIKRLQWRQRELYYQVLLSSLLCKSLLDCFVLFYLVSLPNQSNQATTIKVKKYHLNIIAKLEKCVKFWEKSSKNSNPFNTQKKVGFYRPREKSRRLFYQKPPTPLLTI